MRIVKGRCLLLETNQNAWEDARLVFHARPSAVMTTGDCLSDLDQLASHQETPLSV